jgi:hypothetical protein
MMAQLWLLDELHDAGVKMGGELAAASQKLPAG